MSCERIIYVDFEFLSYRAGKKTMMNESGIDTRPLCISLVSSGYIVYCVKTGQIIAENQCHASPLHIDTALERIKPLDLSATRRRIGHLLGPWRRQPANNDDDGDVRTNLLKHVETCEKVVAGLLQSEPVNLAHVFTKYGGGTTKILTYQSTTDYEILKLLYGDYIDDDTILTAMMLSDYPHSHNAELIVDHSRNGLKKNKINVICREYAGIYTLVNGSQIGLQRAHGMRCSRNHGGHAHNPLVDCHLLKCLIESHHVVFAKICE